MELTGVIHLDYQGEFRWLLNKENGYNLRKPLLCHAKLSRLLCNCCIPLQGYPSTGKTTGGSDPLEKSFFLSWKNLTWFCQRFCSKSEEYEVDIRGGSKP